MPMIAIVTITSISVNPRVACGAFIDSTLVEQLAPGAERSRTAKIDGSGRYAAAGIDREHRTVTRILSRRIGIDQRQEAERSGLRDRPRVWIAEAARADEAPVEEGQAIKERHTA